MALAPSHGSLLLLIEAADALIGHRLDPVHFLSAGQGQQHKLGASLDACTHRTDSMVQEDAAEGWQRIMALHDPIPRQVVSCLPASVSFVAGSSLGLCFLPLFIIANSPILISSICAKWLARAPRSWTSGGRGTVRFLPFTLTSTAGPCSTAI